MKTLSWSVLGVVVLAGCFPNVVGAPCTSDLNCPTGQICVAGACAIGAGGGGGGGGVDGGGGGGQSGENCSDGIDNDADQQIDCGDTDCASKICRAATGTCDLAEVCNGTECPVDEKATPGTVCRPAVDGGCDVAETCDGTSGECGADVVTAMNTACRPASGQCDVAESCTGVDPTCPTDGFQPITTQCRASAGLCDQADFCSGTSAACTDALRPTTEVCRLSLGACDPEERCTGTSVGCPANVISPANTVCRPDAGTCDFAEICDGTRTDCPPDGFVGMGTRCRVAVTGGCDVDEVCNGTSGACPADVFLSGNVCRAAAGDCDVAETCSGTNATCPVDAFASTTLTCRPANGACDALERCTGTATCPADLSSCNASQYCDGANGCVSKKPLASVCVAGTECSSGFCASGRCCDSACSGACEVCSAAGACGLRPSSAVCRPSAGLCDTAETCAGAAACPPDAFAGASSVCRPSAGNCDVGETCTGNSAGCPTDALLGSSVTCRASGGICDIPEVCSGSSPVCPGDALSPNGTVCRASAGACDVPEACTGSAPLCPNDGFQPANTACGLRSCSNGNFTPAPACVGTSNTCQMFAASSCNGYQCNTAGNSCLTTCSVNTDCLSTHFCQAATSCVPKLADGANCVNAGDCISGSCLQGYADTDNDLFGNASAGARFCGSLPITPVRYVANSTDCCDTDANVRPNQTTYFATAVPGACSSRGFDYDCSGFPTHQYPVSGCMGGTCSPAIVFCTNSAGWSTGAFPGCGVTTGILRQCTQGNLTCSGGERILGCNGISQATTPDRCR